MLAEQTIARYWPQRDSGMISPEWLVDEPWLRWRDEWTLDEDVTYLNHGSFGPSPRCVQEAKRHWTQRLESQPMDFFLRQLETHLDLATERLGELVGASGEDLLFGLGHLGGIAGDEFDAAGGAAGLAAAGVELVEVAVFLEGEDEAFVLRDVERAGAFYGEFGHGNRVKDEGGRMKDEKRRGGGDRMRGYEHEASRIGARDGVGGWGRRARGGAATAGGVGDAEGADGADEGV